MCSTGMCSGEHILVCVLLVCVLLVCVERNTYHVEYTYDDEYTYEIVCVLLVCVQQNTYHVEYKYDDEYAYEIVCVLRHHINDIVYLPLVDANTYDYGVATISRLLKMIGLFCKRALQNRRYSAKETYDFKEPTNRSHPIVDDVV